MENIVIKNSTLAGFTVEGILVILLPVLTLVLWKKLIKAPLKPAIVGMIIFPLFGILLKLIPGYFLLLADNPVSRAINGNVWLYSIIGGGLLAGLFEESGRFVAFKWILKKYKSNKDAVSYGIGHGGFESAYLGINCFSYLAIGIMVNSGNAAMLTAGLDAAGTAQTAAIVETIAATPFYIPAVLGVIERISAFIFHISLSVFVFCAAKDKKRLWLFPTAILLHTALNGAASALNLAVQLNIFIIEILIFAYSVTVALFAYKLYKKLENKNFGGNE